METQMHVRGMEVFWRTHLVEEGTISITQMIYECRLMMSLEIEFST